MFSYGSLVHEFSFLHKNMHIFECLKRKFITLNLKESIIFSYTNSEVSSLKYKNDNS